MYHTERFNGISHLLGTVLAVCGAVILVVLAAGTGDPWKIVSISVYGVSLVSLYAFSTLYHSLRGRAKSVFCKLDHSAIYLLIAGTYTPFTLVTLRGVWGWSMFGISWALAVIGIAQELWLKKKNRALSVILYLLMGWMAVAAIQPLLQTLGWNGFVWLAAGGVLYTVGVVFYVLDERLRHAHGIWHLFVLAGSVSHYGAILFHVV